MIEKESYKQIVNIVLVAGLFIIAYFVIKPIFFSIVYGILLAYLFYPFYMKIDSKIKNETLSALLVSITIFTIIFVLLVLLLGTLLNQVVSFYLSLQNIDFRLLIEQLTPSFISELDLSKTIASSLSNSISKVIANLATTLGDFLFDIPIILLQTIIVFLIFFFSLRDGEKAFEYFKSLSHLKKETQDKFFKHFKGITQSVLIGQVVVGMIQGLVAGIGYLIFGVPNAVFLTLLTVGIGIIPIIGPWLVWIPVDAYLFLDGRTAAGIGLLIYGLVFVNWIDTVIRPLIVSRKTEINPAIILIGMIGGLFVFGIIGLIIGPLVLAYVILVLEIYRKQNSNEPIMFEKIKVKKFKIKNKK